MPTTRPTMFSSVSPFLKNLALTTLVARRRLAHEATCSRPSTAYHSPFACGGARFHNVTFQGDVDTVTFGCWRKKTFDKIGTFDEQLVRNQDDELNLRLVRMGGRIFQSPRIRCWYEPRASISALAGQYAQYGFWKVRVIRKHGSPASFRHLVPAIFVGSAMILAVSSLFGSPAGWAFGGLLGTYSFANLLASALRLRLGPHPFAAGDADCPGYLPLLIRPWLSGRNAPPDCRSIAQLFPFRARIFKTLNATNSLRACLSRFSMVPLAKLMGKHTSEFSTQAGL